VRAVRIAVEHVLRHGSRRVRLVRDGSSMRHEYRPMRLQCQLVPQWLLQRSDVRTLHVTV
jgi:hypothetical protein